MRKVLQCPAWVAAESSVVVVVDGSTTTAALTHWSSMAEVLERGRQVTSTLHTRSAGYLVAVGSIAAVTAVLAPMAGQQINATTVALALLLAILFVATGWGSRPAILASVLGMLCFNYFFLPPIGTFTIADPDNWIALGAFLITAMTEIHTAIAEDCPAVRVDARALRKSSTS